MSPEEIAAFANADTRDAWDAACDAAKAARGGAYPIDYSEKVFASGLRERAEQRWGGITFTSFG